MENKINIAELLRNCPKGMELDCTMYENLEFSHIDEKSIYPIKCRAKITDVGSNSHEFTKNGQPNHYSNAKCVIFPKGKTTWEGFHRPFVEGDIVSTESGMYIGIVKSTEDSHDCYTFCSINSEGDFFIDINCLFRRFATEEEKAKLFKAIKDNGYRWNPETKTLEKLPKFKAGDRIKEKQTGVYGEIINVYTNKYDVRIGDKGLYVWFRYQDNWELVSNKFDINTLKPFKSKVLVRNFTDERWKPAIFGCKPINSSTYTVVGGIDFYMCIPYEYNTDLLNTTNDCDDFYKTWGK